MLYDVVIIGAGPAGISASLYTTRANTKTLIFYKGKSRLEKAEKIENYYGFKNQIKGEELYKQGIEQTKQLGTEIKEEEVTKIEKTEKYFIVKTAKREIQTKAVILATGTKNSSPNIKGIKEFEGKGISYCARCDAFFYKNKEVAVLGNGEYALEEVTELLNIAKSVTILTNGKKEPNYRAENIKINPKEIKEINGKAQIEEIKFKDNTKINVNAVFIAEGTAGSVDFARKIGAIIQKDKIVVNNKMETNVEGLYACGDCTGGLLQISKAVYEGTQAGIQAIKYVRQYDKK